MNNLTPREKEVMRMIIDGKSNKEMARIIDISPRTIEVHRGNVMRKSGAKNAADLVRMAMESRDKQEDQQ